MTVGSYGHSLRDTTRFDTKLKQTLRCVCFSEKASVIDCG